MKIVKDKIKIADINLKPHLGNQTRGVEDPKIRQKIIKIINKLVEK